MRFSGFVAASLAATPFVAAHGDAGIPKIFGMPKHLKTREFLTGQKHVGTPARSPRLQSRQGGNAEGRCGANFGQASCAAGYCCSAEVCIPWMFRQTDINILRATAAIPMSTVPPPTVRSTMDPAVMLTKLPLALLLATMLVLNWATSNMVASVSAHV